MGEAKKKVHEYGVNILWNRTVRWKAIASLPLNFHDSYLTGYVLK